MKLKLWQVDAFAERAFAGNPAAVVPLQRWLDDATLQGIANENNLAETAFFVSRGNDAYDLRWFTPTMEVPLCGHATIASAWVIFAELAPELETVRFATKSGQLEVEKALDGRHRMALPASAVEPFVVPARLAGALGACLAAPAPEEIHSAPKGAGGTPGLVAVWPEAALRTLKPSSALTDVLAPLGMNGLIATARGDGAPYDYLMRFFAPGMGVLEAPVTGSANCALTTFWAKRLNKSNLRAYQASPRGGDLLCTDEGDRVILAGPCALYLRGEIEV